MKLAWIWIILIALLVGAKLHDFSRINKACTRLDQVLSQAERTVSK